MDELLYLVAIVVGTFGTYMIWRRYKKMKQLAAVRVKNDRRNE